MKHDNYQFVIKGKEKEIEFAKLFKTTESSTCKEDRSEKWDIKISSKIDVKGLKKIDRTDPNENEDWHWIELKGNTGKNGWLYGQADYFAFETFNYWIIVHKKDLQQFINTYVEKDTIYTSKIPYKLYQRKDRKDLITLVSTIDLCSIASSIIRKDAEFTERKLSQHT